MLSKLGRARSKGWIEQLERAGWERRIHQLVQLVQLVDVRFGRLVRIFQLVRRVDDELLVDVIERGIVERELLEWEHLFERQRHQLEQLLELKLF